MPRTFALVTVLCCLLAPAAGAESRSKRQAVDRIRSLEPDLTRLSRRIWADAETALLELRSSAHLADYAEGMGFKVRRGVAGMPTAFVATYGSGEPVIGILGEFDALPGISQKAQAAREPLVEGGAGHGCGHNLFGPASLGAALAVKELIESGRLKGTIRFYGTPAEEAVGGKLYMLRAGLFDDLAAAVAWHPDTETRADTQSSQAMIDFAVEFKGKAAHAAYDPWNGRSAVDGMEIFTFSLNLMREHVRPTVRMHYSILEGGKVPNVVPEVARLWCWVRDSKMTSVQDLMKRIRRMVDGAALAAGVEARLTVQSGSYEMLPSRSGARALQHNLEWLGPPRFSPEEQAFARELQAEAEVEPSGIREVVEPLDEDPGEPQGGSTDVADVSWNVPTIHLVAATAPDGVPWHSWAVVAASGSAVGERGMMYAAKALAATLVDLFENPDLRRAMREEFDQAVQGRTYVPFIPEGPPAPPRPAP